MHSANEAKDTVYFEDDFTEAKRVTMATLDAFDDLCRAASSTERTALIEQNRPKMAQLQEEFRMLEQALIHDD